MRKNLAVRQRDLSRLQVKWGTNEQAHIDTLECRIGRAIASFCGTEQLYTQAMDQKPGRPAGVRGCKKGTGRRSAGGWKQVEAGEAGAWLEVLSEMLQQKYGWAMRPSAELTLALIARAEPKGPEAWSKRMPLWAMKAWVKAQEHKVSVPGVVYASHEDTCVLTEEQEKELEKELEDASH